jgi:hypothetical protein
MNAAEQIALYRRMKRFFNGTSRSLLDSLITKFSAPDELSAFARHLIQSDLETVLEFYERCSKKNRRIKTKLELAEKLLPQDRVDDYLVLLNQLKT